MTPEQVAAALAVDRDEWVAELPLIREWFEFLGDTVPAELHRQLAELETRLG